MLKDKARIILADDNEDFTFIFSEYLKMAGKDDLEVVATAKNGFEALDMIASKRPDIVLLDLLMPRLDGFGVLNKIKSMKLKKKPAVIILSAIAETTRIQACLDLGALFFVEKPFDMLTLTNRLIQLKKEIIK